MSLTTIVRAWLALALILAFAAYGGAGDLVRPLLAIAVAVALVAVVPTMRAQMHPPPIGWMAVLFLPLLVIAFLQILPLGWHHPWLTDDLADLGITHSAWSIDPATSTQTLVWMLTLAGLALVVSVLARGNRVRGLADALVYVAVTSALLGLCLALTAAPWPSTDQIGRVRGPFIYPNHAAAFWAGCLPLSAMLAHHHGGALRWGGVAALALAILLSGSRGGILVAALVMVPLTVAYLPRRRRLWWIVSSSISVIAWLWIIGIGEVVDKFGRLRGDEGLTLSGRVTIWQSAWPVLTDVGALGSGGGTTIAAFRRSGDTHFTDVLVNHLHSDPLEWWLEYGWLGLLVAVIAITAAVWHLCPQPVAMRDPARRPLVIGAAAGLLILALHGCGDFIWHSPAVAMTGVLLMCILALSGHERAPTGAARAWLRAGCLAVAGLLALGAWPSWRWNQSNDLARDVERLVVARQAANLPLDGAEVLERAQATPAGNVRLAATRAWLARAAGDPVAARYALEEAAHLAPGDAAAWAERALQAAAHHDSQAMATAIRRALVWAPTWPDIQRTALQLVADHDRLALPPEQTRAIIDVVLAVDHAQPEWFFTLAAEVLGTDALAARLSQAGPALARSSAEWLARHGPLAEWLALRRSLTGPEPRRLPAGLALVHAQLLAEQPWEPLLPLAAEDRRALAEMLGAAALPLPAALRQALTQDGAPWERWSRPIDLLDPATRDELTLLLRSELHRPWARTWSERISLCRRALAGEQAVISRDSDPAVLACLAGIDPLHQPAELIADGLRPRVQALLGRWREWEWQELPASGRWSWWYGDGGAPALIAPERWTGLVIDGAWIGWVRGPTDLAPLLGSGLRRVVLLDP